MALFRAVLLSAILLVFCVCGLEAVIIECEDEDVLKSVAPSKTGVAHTSFCAEIRPPPLSYAEIPGNEDFCFTHSLCAGRYFWWWEATDPDLDIYTIHVQIRDVLEKGGGQFPITIFTSRYTESLALNVTVSDKVDDSEPKSPEQSHAMRGMAECADAEAEAKSPASGSQTCPPGWLPVGDGMCVMNELGHPVNHPLAQDSCAMFGATLANLDRTDAVRKRRRRRRAVEEKDYDVDVDEEDSEDYDDGSEDYDDDPDYGFDEDDEEDDLWEDEDEEGDEEKDDESYNKEEEEGGGDIREAIEDGEDDEETLKEEGDKDEDDQGDADDDKDGDPDPDDKEEDDEEASEKTKTDEDKEDDGDDGEEDDYDYYDEEDEEHTDGNDDIVKDLDDASEKKDKDADKTEKFEKYTKVKRVYPGFEKTSQYKINTCLNARLGVLAGTERLWVQDSQDDLSCLSYSSDTGLIQEEKSCRYLNNKYACVFDTSKYKKPTITKFQLQFEYAGRAHRNFTLNVEKQRMRYHEVREDVTRATIFCEADGYPKPEVAIVEATVSTHPQIHSSPHTHNITGKSGVFLGKFACVASNIFGDEATIGDLQLWRYEQPHRVSLITTGILVLLILLMLVGALVAINRYKLFKSWGTCHSFLCSCRCPRRKPKGSARVPTDIFPQSQDYVYGDVWADEVPLYVRQARGNNASASKTSGSRTIYKKVTEQDQEQEQEQQTN